MGTGRCIFLVPRAHLIALLVSLLAVLGALTLAGPAHAAKTSTKAAAPTAAQVKKCQAVLRKGSKARPAAKRACRIVLKKAARARAARRAVRKSSRGPARTEMASPSYNLDQCANGGVGDPPVACSGAAWQNGNLNQNQAHYLEGDSVPYRARMGNLTLGPNSITIEWDTTKSGKHALDYLRSYNATEATASPCSGVSGCSGWTHTTLAIPVDPNVSAAGVTQLGGSFDLWGGTITSVSAYTLNGTYAGDSSTRITINFTASVANPVLAWGGHVATRSDWGLGNSAISITGSPYHMRIITGGNQDRSLSAGAVIYPAQVTVVKDAVPNDPQDFPFTTTNLPSASFTLDDDADPTLSNTVVMGGITTFNTKTVTETATAGWDLTSLGCIDDLTQGSVGTPNLGTRTVSVALVEGRYVTCTFTNSRKPKIELTKDVAPNSDPGLFNLFITQGQTTIDSAADQGDGGTTGPNTVAAGSYGLSETAGTNSSLADYDQSLACVTRGTQTPVTVSNGAVSLAYGDDVVCTFTNTRKQGSIELRKAWVGTPGQTTLQIGTSAGGSQVDSQQTGPNGQAPLTTGATTVNTGTYYMSETGGLADYDATLACVNTTTQSPTPVTPGANGSVAVSQDDVIVCTFTNTRKQGLIELRKAWVGTPGQTTLQIGTSAGGSQVDSQLTGADGQAPLTTGANTVDTGTYYVSETGGLTNYDAALACVNTTNPQDPTPVTPGQDGSVAVGQDDVIVCTFTNTRKQGSIELRKVWVGTPGQTTLQIGTSAGGNGTDSQLTGANGQAPLSTDANTVDTGTYYVSETGGLTNYDAALACVNTTTQDPTPVTPGANGSVAVGKDDVIVCTFTNSRLPRIKVVKDFVGAPAGVNINASVATTGQTPTDVVGPTALADGEDTGFHNLAPGSYSVSEASGTADLANYDSTLACTGATPTGNTGTSATVTLAYGDEVVCTFTNSRKQGSIELRKAWVGTPGQTTLAIGTTAGGSQVDSQQTGPNGQAPLTTGATSVDTGTYYLSETGGLADYDAALACLNTKDPKDPTLLIPGPDGAVAVGQNDVIVCTFTNSRKQGSIELRKVWVGAPGQTTLAIGTTAGAGDVDSQLTGPNGQAPLTTDATSVDTGTYYLSETGGLTDYESSLACLNTKDPKDPTPFTPGQGGAVAVGQNDVIVCTFTNTRKPDFLVTKTATPNPASFGQKISYTIQITHIGEPLAIDMSGLVVTDTFADSAATQTLALMGGDTANPGFLDAGETWVFGAPGPDETLGPITRTADVCGTITNTATAAISPKDRVPADAQSPPVLDDPANHVDQESVPVICAPDLQVAKTGPAQVGFNDTITYTVAVSHAPTSDGSPVTAADVKVSDPKLTPNPLVLVSGDDGDALLEAAETWIYQVTDSQPVTLPATTCGPLTNTAILAPAPGETNLANNESTATTTVICTLDVGITKTSDKPTYQAGEAVSYTVRVTNNGQLPIPFAQVQVSDPQVPLALQGAAPAELAPGATLTYTASRPLSSADCGQLPNTATVTLVTPVQAETTTANNSATHTVSVSCPPPVTIAGAPAKLRIDKRGPRAARAGKLVTYRITVRNAGTTDALNVVIRDPLPSGFTLARRAAGATFRGGTLTWKVGTLAPGRPRTVRLTVRIDKALGGRRCNVGAARASNAGQVRDAACTRIKAVAPVITPPVTG